MGLHNGLALEKRALPVDGKTTALVFFFCHVQSHLGITCSWVIYNKDLTSINPPPPITPTSLALQVRSFNFRSSLSLGSELKQQNHQEMAELMCLKTNVFCWMKYGWCFRIPQKAVDIENYPRIYRGFYISQLVVWDFFLQQYDSCTP